MRRFTKKKKKYMTGILLIMVLSMLAGLTGYAEEITGPGSELKNKNNETLNGISIYVSKRTRVLLLKQNGNLIAEYPVSIGGASDDGNKKIEGDMRTPSGEFYVCTRNDKSIAYLALGLSYPGVKDAERGYTDGIITKEQRDEIIQANQLGKQPPWDTPLGGAIEIHGCRTPDGFTHGCVALDNEAMDVLWNNCNLGVPVTIGP
ncbi:L,D-transpeptidase [Clostridium sp. E02]|uniref:L,D-transpeptidase family protein n=1 Tax=Clostridium sp. E02 TaxID=2487134 RepID=UPI000F530CCE|nr:L,D-transpeptidase [Clostridium sp. E02]